MKANDIVVTTLLQPKKINIRLYDDTSSRYRQMEIELTKNQALSLMAEIIEELKKL